MAKPTTKSQLLADIARERAALEQLLSTVGADQMTQPDIVGTWSIKDVLAHLIAWHQLCMGWYRMGLSGGQPVLPAQGFNRHQLSQLNQQIYEQYREEALSSILERFKLSSQEIYQFVETLSEEELFTHNIYAWTGKHALLSFLTPNTSEHYHWAQQEIRKGLKAKAKRTARE